MTNEERIKADAERFTKDEGYQKVYIAGATAYASDRHQLQQENTELRRQNDKLKQQATGWRPLLEEVLKHDAAFGELSIEMIEKIKKFLYGE